MLKWHDVTQPYEDHRSHMIYGESTRPRMDQQRSLRLRTGHVQPSIQEQLASATHGLLSTSTPLDQHQYTYTLIANNTSSLSDTLNASSTNRMVTNPS